MKTKACFFLAALLCSVYGNPLGSQTICETQPKPLLPGLLSAGIGPAACPYGLTIGALAPPTMFEAASLPSYLPIVQPSTTVCETVPTPTMPIQPFGFGMDPTHSWPYNMGKTTVCETTPNVPIGVQRYLPGLDYGVGSTTVCDTSVGVPVMPYSLMPYNLYPRHGHTTVCETTPTPTLPSYVPFL